MNAWQIVGTVFSVLGTMLMAYGAHVQSQADGKFQHVVGKYVENQQAEDVPEIVATAIKKNGDDYVLEVKNVGRRSATKVKLLFSDKSAPNIFSGNLISGASEIPKNTTYMLSLNLFSAANRVLSAQNVNNDYKKQVASSLKKFNNGEITLIPRFYVEYYHGDKKLISPTYFLVLSSQDTKLGFGKEE